MFDDDDASACSCIACPTEAPLELISDAICHEHAAQIKCRTVPRAGFGSDECGVAEVAFGIHVVHVAAVWNVLPTIGSMNIQSNALA